MGAKKEKREERPWTMGWGATRVFPGQWSCPGALHNGTQCESWAQRLLMQNSELLTRIVREGF